MHVRSLESDTFRYYCISLELPRCFDIEEKKKKVKSALSQCPKKTMIVLLGLEQGGDFGGVWRAMRSPS